MGRKRWIVNWHPYISLYCLVDWATHLAGQTKQESRNNDLPNQTENQQPRRRRPILRAGLWIFNGALLMAGLFFILGVSLSGRNLNAPTWVIARVVNGVNDSMSAGHITLGRLQVQVDGAGIPRVFMGDLGVFDARGTEIVRLNNVGARFSIPALMAGQIKPEQINLSGAQMTLRRQLDGRFDVSFGGGSAVSGTVTDVLDALDTAFASEPLDEVSSLMAEDMTITLEDARSGRFWQITEGSMQMRRGETGLDISIAFDVFNGTEELAETVIGVRTDTNTSKVSIGATFRNAASADIALQSPVLSFLGVLNAPISGALRADFDEQGALSNLTGTLEMAEGALQPNPDISAFGFSSAKAYFEFDPAEQKIEFSEVSFISEAASLTASGQAYLRDLQGGWPSTLIGQFALSDLKAHPKGVFENEVAFDRGAADFRMRLNPFSVEIGQFVIMKGDEKIVATGGFSALDTGWEVSGDFELNEIAHDRLLSLWPVSFSPNTRDWLVGHMTSGLLSNVRAAFRIKPGQAMRRSVGWQFRDTTVRYIDAQPPIEDASGFASINGNMFTLIVEQGIVKPPLGGAIAVADSSIQIPDFTLKPAPMDLRLNGNANSTAVLSLLNEPPFRILRNASFEADVSKGTASFAADISFPLKRKIGLDDVDYSVTGVLENVSSDTLVPGRTLTAERLSLIANNQFVEIAGPMRLGKVPAEMIWRQEAGQSGKSDVNGTVELSIAFIEEFGIGLPKSALSGAGVGQFHIALELDQPPKFTLNSDLNRLGLRINQIGWRKSKGTTGSLSVAGTLGAQPHIDRLEINASGLNASGGQVTMGENGAMRAATFARVRVGGWLDAPVTLRGRGRGVVPSVHITGGTIDIRKTALAGGDSTTSGSGGPISLALNKVIVSEGITLTDFVGEFNSVGGISGNFNARMNGKTPLIGRLAPDANGTEIQIQSDNAGGVLRNAGVMEYAESGRMDLTLRPRPENGVYDGTMQIRNTSVKKAPGMTDLLSAISIVGLLEQLSGNGILFEQVDAQFRLTPTSVQLIRSSAVGPSLGVSLDGVFDLTTSTMDMQGVVSPVYFLNGIGQIFSRRGEGLFGFNFRIRGTSAKPRVTVNPLSILTPGIFRDIFRAQPPRPSQ